MNILQRLRETYGSSAKDTPQWTERERRHHLEVAAMEMKKQQEAQATGELDASSDVPLPSGGASSAGGASGAGAAASEMTAQINDGYAAAGKRAEKAIAAATDAAVQETQNAQAEADAEYEAQRRAVNLDEAQALDNSALYAELRGDDGGLGRAQYDSIQNTAARSRAAISRAQTELAADTAARIAALQADGEYEKAERLLDLAQERLSSIAQMWKWAGQQELDERELEAKIAQQQAEYELSAARLSGYTASGAPTADGARALAALGEAMLKKGLVPNSAQLAAMGMSREQALAYIAGLKSDKTEAAPGSERWFAALYEKYGEDAPLMLRYSYGKLGVSTKSAAEALLAKYYVWRG